MCECKELCCRMQKEGLRAAIKALEVPLQSTGAIRTLLSAVSNMLSVYNCLPAQCLIERVAWVHSNIRDAGVCSLYVTECDLVDMLIKELQTFVNS